MALKKYLDYDGLARVLTKINEKYAPVQAIVYKATVPTISSLPDVSTEVQIGWMYTVTTGGLTTDDFAVGAGQTLQDDENVVAVNVGTDEEIIMKWDIVGGVFKIEDRLQFGIEFPSNPSDGDTFLYMGEKVYGYKTVDPKGTENPSEEEWYEYDSSTETYFLTEDVTVDPSKTYYSRYEKYQKGVIYVYQMLAGDWIAQPSGDSISSISDSDIEALFG